MNFLRKLLHVEPEIIEVQKYIQVRHWSNEIDGILADIRWEKGAINDRIEHPEKYPNENIPVVIEQAQALIKNLQDRLVSAL